MYYSVLIDKLKFKYIAEHLKMIKIHVHVCITVFTLTYLGGLHLIHTHQKA